MPSPSFFRAAIATALLMSFAFVTVEAQAPCANRASYLAGPSIDYTTGGSACSSTSLPAPENTQCSASCNTAANYQGTAANFKCVNGAWTLGPLCTYVAPPTPCSTVPTNLGYKVDMNAAGTTCKNAVTSPFASGSTCTYGCASGFRPGAPATCTNGVWSNTYCIGYQLASTVFMYGKRV